MKTVKQILLDAAEILERDGWTQRHYWRPSTNCFCATGALQKAAGAEFKIMNTGWHDEHGDPDYDIVFPADEFGRLKDEYRLRYDAEQLVTNLLRDGEWQYSWGLISWNDQPTRTAAEVIALFRAAAATLEG